MICISLMINEVQHFFKMLLSHPKFFRWKFFVYLCTPIFNRGLCTPGLGKEWPLSSCPWYPSVISMLSSVISSPVWHLHASLNGSSFCSLPLPFLTLLIIAASFPLLYFLFCQQGKSSSLLCFPCPYSFLYMSGQNMCVHMWTEARDWQQAQPISILFTEAWALTWIQSSQTQLVKLPSPSPRLTATPACHLGGCQRI